MHDLKGSVGGDARASPRLDEEREASLADEGGASGAVVESQDVETLRKLAQRPAGRRTCSRRRRPTDCAWNEGATTAFVAAASFAAAALGVLAYRRWAR